MAKISAHFLSSNGRRGWRRSNHIVAEAVSIEGRGRALMAAVEEHDLEGIVAKRKGDPYRRGVHWWKIKNRAYSQAEGRYELMNHTGRVAAIATDGRQPKLRS